MEKFNSEDVVRVWDNKHAASIIDAANIGGSWAMDAAVELLRSKAIDLYSEDDPIVWSHLAVAAIMQRVSERYMEDEGLNDRLPYPATPKIENGRIYFGWGRSWLCLDKGSAYPEIIVGRDDEALSDEEWASHPRRLAVHSVVAD